MPDPEPTPAPLPSRPPRPIGVHVVVDAAVVFLAIAVLALVLGFGLLVPAIVALLVGLAAAPITQRREIRALEARRDRARDDGPSEP